MRSKPTATLLSGAVLGCCLAGCGQQASEPKPVSPSERKRQVAGDEGPAGDIKSLKREEVQAGVKRSLLRGKRPVRAERVSCPLDVPAVKGETAKCRATIAGRRVPIAVRITEVSGRGIRYSIRTAGLPR